MTMSSLPSFSRFGVVMTASHHPVLAYGHRPHHHSELRPSCNSTLHHLHSLHSPIVQSSTQPPCWCPTYPLPQFTPPHALPPVKHRPLGLMQHHCSICNFCAGLARPQQFNCAAPLGGCAAQYHGLFNCAACSLAFLRSLSFDLLLPSSVA